MLKALAEYQRANGYPPTQAELARIVGKSRAWVRTELVRLEAKGLIEWRSGAVRTIRLTESGLSAAEGHADAPGVPQRVTELDEELFDEEDQ